MTLFNDTEIFSNARASKQVIDLPDADIVLYDGFFSKAESDYYYETLLNATAWREYQMPMYDKIVTVPRMVAWYGDCQEITTDPLANQWTSDLLEIRYRIEKEIEVPFNGVLLNLYRNGKDGVSWHSDTEHKYNKNTIIASVTFGETRLFRLRHKTRTDIAQIEIPLHHGSFLLMAGTTQTYWQHQVPKTARMIQPRINLTFRQRPVH